MAEKEYVPVNKRKPPQAIISLRKRAAFLKKLGQTGKVGQSSREVGYASTTFLQNLRRTDEEFARQWDEAMQAAVDQMEDEMVRRAKEGVKKPTVYKGQLCYQRSPEDGALILDTAGDPIPIYVTEYSDSLLMFYLRAAKPNKYRDNIRVDTTIQGKIGVAVLPMTAASVDAWAKQALDMHNSQDHVTIDGEATEITEGTEVARA